MQMNNDPFQRSSTVVWIGIVILMSLPVSLVMVTGSDIISRKSWSASAFIVFFYGGIFLTFAYLCSLPIVQLMMKYTDYGVEQPSILGSKFLYWHDVQEVRNITTANIVLVGSATKININPILFVNQQGFWAEIRSRIPESVFPSDAQINQEILRGKRNDSMRSALGAYIFTVLVFVVGTNVTATIVIGLLVLAYAVIETRRWIRYGRK